MSDIVVGYTPPNQKYPHELYASTSLKLHLIRKWLFKCSACSAVRTIFFIPLYLFFEVSELYVSPLILLNHIFNCFLFFIIVFIFVSMFPVTLPSSEIWCIHFFLGFLSFFSHFIHTHFIILLQPHQLPVLVQLTHPAIIFLINDIPYLINVYSIPTLFPKTQVDA